MKSRLLKSSRNQCYIWVWVARKAVHYRQPRRWPVAVYGRNWKLLRNLLPELFSIKEDDLSVVCYKNSVFIQYASCHFLLRIQPWRDRPLIGPEHVLQSIFTRQNYQHPICKRFSHTWEYWFLFLFAWTIWSDSSRIVYYIQR